MSAHILTLVLIENSLPIQSSLYITALQIVTTVITLSIAIVKVNAFHAAIV